MTNQFTDEQVEAAAKAIWIESLPEANRDWGKLVWSAPNMREDRERIRALAQARAALEAAAGVAPQAPSEPCCDSCEEAAVFGFKPMRPVQPSSTVDEGELEHVIEGVINETVEMPLSTRLVLARAVVEAIGGESR